MLRTTHRGACLKRELVATSTWNLCPIGLDADGEYGSRSNDSVERTASRPAELVGEEVAKIFLVGLGFLAGKTRPFPLELGGGHWLALQVCPGCRDLQQSAPAANKHKQRSLYVPMESSTMSAGKQRS